MQILYVGNGNFKHHGNFYYDVGRKLFNGLTRLGHNVYFLSDRDTSRAATIFGRQWFGAKQCNQIFLNICRNFHPDLILLGHANIIANDSLEQARALFPQVKIAQFNVDPVFDPHTQRQITGKAPFCDATFVTTAGGVLRQFSHPGSIVTFMPNPVDLSIEWPRCFEHSDQANDVFWALRAEKGTYPGDPRIELPLYLEKSGKVKIDYHGMNGKPAVRSAQYFHHIAHARMGLNLSNTCYRGTTTPAAPEGLYLYSSDRISHYMGSGLLIFSPRHYRLEEMFAEDREMILFTTKEELLEKVIYYKEHDSKRRTVAQAGWQKVATHYNERLVAQYILEQTFRMKLTEPYAWPTETY